MKTSYFVLIMGTLILLLTGVSFTLYSKSLGTPVGEKAVKYMYDFDSTKELSDNMDKLSAITTKSVFSKLTIDNIDRSLSTYLKFKNLPCEVVILRSTNTYILYTLKTDALSSGRKFIFMYQVNALNKISEVREAEVVDFYK